MKTQKNLYVVMAFSLAFVSIAEAQSGTETAAEAEVAVEVAVEAAAADAEVTVEAEVEAAEAAVEATELSAEAAGTQPPASPQAMAQEADPAIAQVHLRFRAIRLYAGAALQVAPVDAGDFRTLCELPCNADVEPGSYQLNVHRLDGRDYALPTSIDFSEDARISLKYGASTGAWVGGIVALTAIVGVLISGGIAIAGAANDNSGQTRSGLIGLGLSSLVFGGGLVTFLMSERGLRAQVLEN